MCATATYLKRVRERDRDRREFRLICNFFSFIFFFIYIYIIGSRHWEEIGSRVWILFSVSLVFLNVYSTQLGGFNIYIYIYLYIFLCVCVCASSGLLYK